MNNYSDAVLEQVQKFPSTRYQGSKRKLLPWIFEAIRDYKFQTALDVFGGSGAVSYLLKAMGKDVTYNDYLRFNYLVGKALIENSKITMTTDEHRRLIRRVADRDYGDFIERTFRNVYYLNAENRWLDTVVENIRCEFPSTHDSQRYKHALAMFALFQSCLVKRPFNLFHRRNLTIRTRDVVRTFGNKVTWDTQFGAHFCNFVIEANAAIFEGTGRCRATNKSVFRVDPTGYDLVYIDPPYFRQDATSETSDYRKCYHFLEGLAKYDEWPSLIDYDTKTMRLKAGSGNGEITASTIKETFDGVFDHFRKSIIVISYKKHGLPSIDYIVKRAKTLGKHVSVRSLHYSYALNGQNGDAKRNREMLIIAS